MKRLLLSAALAATFAPNAFGQIYERPSKPLSPSTTGDQILLFGASENDDSHEVVSIGQRIGSTQTDALTAPASIITEAEIANRGQQHVSELLRSLPGICLLYTSPSPRDATLSRMPSSA